MLIRNARVYAPVPLGLCDVLLAGGRIAAVGPNFGPSSINPRRGSGRTSSVATISSSANSRGNVGSPSPAFLARRRKPFAPFDIP